MRINEVVNLTLFFEMDPSRRGFLRKLGKGAMAVAGAAALSMLPKGAQAGEKPTVEFEKSLKILETDPDIIKVEYDAESKTVKLTVIPQSNEMFNKITAQQWAMAFNNAYPEKVKMVALVDPDTKEIYTKSEQF
jgi:hypothetical protein